jgi:serine phosphatase RsbU (regulator of sigma subunit)
VYDDRVLLAVVDGLGHGEAAAAAAERAAATLAATCGLTLPALILRCHEVLRRTRGVVLGVATVDPAEQSLTWIGIGNVQGAVIRSQSTAQHLESLLVRGGVVGLLLPTLQPSVKPLALGDLLVLATDGIRPDFAVRPHRGRSSQRIAEQVLAEYGKKTDDALVLVARYRGRETPP